MTESERQSQQTDLERCIATLNQLAQSPQSCLRTASCEAQVADAAALLLRRIKAAKKREGRARDQEVVSQASIRHKRTEKEYGLYLADDPEPVDDSGISLGRRRVCYVCKKPYQRLHHFYDALCDSCGDHNFHKRHQSADLTGRVFVVTGARIKIGFQIGLKLLRAGAFVAVTSRFPHDAAYRYSLETDSADWMSRLRIHAADFRSIDEVDRMCRQLSSEHVFIDGLINNAAQTVRRPPLYYRQLIERESQLQQSLASRVTRSVAPTDQPRPGPPRAITDPTDHARQLISLISCSSLMTQVPVLVDDRDHDPAEFPLGKVDTDGQQIDARDANSWTMPMSDVGLGELLEVHAINSLVPFLLIQRNDPLLMACPRPDRYIVNVSAMEGQFNTHFKASRHPHTNMAKAGINMVTRTCAKEFAARGIYMNSVDTGWITNEFPLPQTEAMKRDGFEPPLDEIDAAARVLDPVFRGVGQAEHVYGKFLKDYREVAW